MFHSRKSHEHKILTAGTITAMGLLFFKYFPMSIWGRDILFDTSGHIAGAMFVLYILWFFVDQNKNWHTPFFIFGAMVLMVIAFQRIADHAHNDIGLLGGLVLGVIAVGTAEWKTLKKQLSF